MDLLFLKTERDIEDLEEAIVEAWKAEMEKDWSNFDLPEITAEEAFQAFNPGNVIMSAEAYDDPDMTAWLWDNVLKMNDVYAVYGEGFAIVYDSELIDAL